MQQLISSPPLLLHGINWQPLSAVQMMLVVSMRPAGGRRNAFDWLQQDNK